MYSSPYDYTELVSGKRKAAVSIRNQVWCGQSPATVHAFLSKAKKKNTPLLDITFLLNVKVHSESVSSVSVPSDLFSFQTRAKPFELTGSPIKEA